MEVNETTIILVGCALLGSVRSSIEFGKGKHCVARFVDILIGAVIGLSVVYHFTNQLSLALSALAAVIAGASGAMVLDVIMAMIPSLTKISIKSWLKKWLQ